MPVVVLEVVALILERVKGLILDLPPRPAGPHHRLDRARVERDVGHPTPTSDFPLPVGLLVEQVVDAHVDRALAQAEMVGPGEGMFDPLRVGESEFLDLPTGPAPGELPLQALVRIRLDVQNKEPAVAGDLPDVRRVGVERVLHQDRLQIGVTFVQVLAEPLGGVALAVVLLGAVGIENRLEVEREDFLLGGVNDHGGQARMAVRSLAVAMRARGAVIAVHLGGREVLDAVDRDDEVALPILVLFEHPGPAQFVEELGEDRPQRRREDRVERRPHLRVAGDRSNPIDGF